MWKICYITHVHTFSTQWSSMRSSGFLRVLIISSQYQNMVIISLAGKGAGHAMIEPNVTLIALNLASENSLISSQSGLWICSIQIGRIIVIFPKLCMAMIKRSYCLYHIKPVGIKLSLYNKITSLFSYTPTQHLLHFMHKPLETLYH